MTLTREQPAAPKRALTRRELLGAGAGALLALGLARSAEAAEATPTTAEVAAPRAPARADAKVVQWWSDKTDTASSSSVNTYLVEPFNAANTDVKLEFTALPNYYNGVLDTAIAAGKVGDIFTHNGPAWIAPYADSGWAADISGYDSKYGWGQKYWPWIWEQAKFKGTPRLIPAEFESLRLFYNKKEFDANGWSIPGTYEDTQAFGKKLQEAGKIAYAVGKDTGAYEWWLCYTCHAWAGNYATWEGLSGKRPWTDDLFVESFQKVADLWQAGLLTEKQSTSISVGDARGLFARERAMLLLEGTWTLRTIDQWAPNLQWDTVPAPVWRPDARKALAIGAGEIFVLNGRGTQMDDAAYVANSLFFGDRKQILTWADKPGIPGVTIPPMFYEEGDFPEGFNPAYRKQILEMVAAARDNDFGFLAWCSWPQKTEAYMYTNLPNVWLGQMSAKDFLAGAQKVFEADLASGSVNPGPEPRR